MIKLSVFTTKKHYFKLLDEFSSFYNHVQNDPIDISGGVILDVTSFFAKYYFKNTKYY